ncbi:MAG: alpha/beta hydrolase [Tistlia sp.]|uniref:alpha/beta fold hydrolase n=1 Tax=Tistlia sp. TaxID=3057121 RepID=UPI0034A37B17
MKQDDTTGGPGGSERAGGASPPAPRETLELIMDDGAAIRVRCHGSPRSPRLYVSHGNGFAVDGYLPFWGPLAERYEVVAFDMRNHGRNPPAGADGHHYPQMARDLAQVVAGVEAALGARPRVGVFHSMSARAAMKQAVQGSAPWDALLLYDPPNVPPREHPLYEPMRAFELRLVEFALNRPERFAAPEELARSYAESRAHRSWVGDSHTLMAQALLRRDAARGDWVLSCPREYEAAIYLAALTLDLWPAASALGCPTLLVGADPERQGGPPTGRTNQALAAEQGYRYEAVRETGHLLQIERPEECRRLLQEFLGGLGIA